MHQIKSFGVLQTAKVMGALYFILGFLFAVAVLIMSAVAGKGGGHERLLLLVGAPSFYGFFGFIVTTILCWLYNAIASSVGGIEVELGSAVTNLAAADSSPDIVTRRRSPLFLILTRLPAANVPRD